MFTVWFQSVISRNQKSDHTTVWTWPGMSNWLVNNRSEKYNVSEIIYSAFSPALFSSVKSNLCAFPPFGVDHLRRWVQQLYSGAQQMWTKQAEEDRVEGAVSMRFQTNSGAAVLSENVFWPRSTLTAKSTAHFWTNPDPVGSCVNFSPLSQQQHASMSNHGQTWRMQAIYNPMSVRLYLHYQSLPTWQFWPVEDIAPAPDTSRQWESVFFFLLHNFTAPMRSAAKFWFTWAHHQLILTSH